MLSCLRTPGALRGGGIAHDRLDPPGAAQHVAQRAGHHGVLAAAGEVLHRADLAEAERDQVALDAHDLGVRAHVGPDDDAALLERGQHGRPLLLKTPSPLRAGRRAWACGARWRRGRGRGLGHGRGLRGPPRPSRLRPVIGRLATRTRRTRTCRTRTCRTRTCGTRTRRGPMRRSRACGTRIRGAGARRSRAHRARVRGGALHRAATTRVGNGSRRRRTRLRYRRLLDRRTRDRPR
jgi:hypothetical protein